MDLNKSPAVQEQVERLAQLLLRTESREIPPALMSHLMRLLRPATEGLPHVEVVRSRLRAKVRESVSGASGAAIFDRGIVAAACLHHS